MVCPDDNAIFDMRQVLSSVGHTREATLSSTTLMYTVTSLTSSSISVTLTIHIPALWDKNYMWKSNSDIACVV